MSKVSIFIPTFNRLNLLKVAIASVLNQSYTDYALHVFDNASSDGTHHLLNRLVACNNKIIYHRNSSNVGAAKNFMQIFKEASQASGDLFCVCSDDDFLLPNFLENAVKKLGDHDFADFIIMDCLQLDSEYKLTVHAEPSGELSEYRDPPKMMLPGVPYIWTSMLFKKSLASIYLNAEMKYEIGADMRFLSLATALHPYIYYSKPGACFVNHGDNYSKSRSTVREGRAYQVVQLHRYVEVINCPAVTESERLHARAQLKASCQCSTSLAFLGEGLIAVQKMWENANGRFSREIVSDLCAELRSEGEHSIDWFIKFLAGSKTLRFLYRKLLYPILRRRREKRLSALRALQDNKLNNEFLSIARIRADAASL